MKRIGNAEDAYNPYYLDPADPDRFDEPPLGFRRRRFSTSPLEIFHIFVAMTVLAGILWYVFEENEAFDPLVQEIPTWGRITAAILISALGFVLHELGHKFTAQHFGHWSEFRANWVMLVLAVVIAYLTQIPFAAPGATWHTAQGRDEQGRISAMGPLVNLAIAVAALGIAIPAGGTQTTAGLLALIVVFFSAFLSAFNLLPVWQLDGRKVFAWSIPVWIAMMGLSIGLVAYGYQEINV